MSLSLPTTLFSVSFSSSSATLLHSHSLPVIKWKPTNKNGFLPTFCLQKQTCTNQQLGDHHQPNKTTNSRRNILLGAGVLTTTLATTLTAQVQLAIGSPSHEGSSTPIQEFGSQPRLLNSTIRVLVAKSKRSKNGREEVAVLVVEGVDVKTDGPVRFDVYVAKPNGGDQVGSSDFGGFAGSLVDLARIRVGRKSPNGVLELGINGLLNEIQAAEDSIENLVVTLQPRIGIGEVMIGGVHVEYRAPS